jgi:hypothetical protein
MANNTVTYGFVGLQHLYNTRVAQVGVQRIYAAIQESANEHTRQINALLATMVAPTVAAQVQVELPGGQTLQPIDEYGNPIPVKPSGNYTVGFPIQGGGFAWGSNRVSRELLTVEEANRMTLEAMIADADWMLGALLDNVYWTYNDKVGANGGKGLGNISIQPLANGDSVEYVFRNGTKSTDNHYLAQAAAISDANNPYPTIFAELFEHPSNSGPWVAYIASDQVTATEGLATFVQVRDPDIAYGVSQVVNAEMDAPIRGPGDRVIGKVDNLWIVEWSSLPSGYIMAHAQGAGPVVNMREYPAPALQGFFPEEHSPDGNLREMRMLRYAGFGVYNRVAMVVQYIGGGAYAIPTGYDAPLSV